MCRDLGGKTLVLGGGRNRKSTSISDAKLITLDFITDYIDRTSDHGTCLCFEPLGQRDSDFINSVYESINFVKLINHPAVRVQLDAKAMAINGELDTKVFRAAAPFLVHVHANEPDLGILGTSGKIDNHQIASFLRDINYGGYVSIEQKMISGKAPLEALRQSARIMKECYGW